MRLYILVVKVLAESWTRTASESWFESPKGGRPAVVCRHLAALIEREYLLPSEGRRHTSQPGPPTYKIPKQSVPRG